MWQATFFIRPLWGGLQARRARSSAIAFDNYGHDLMRVSAHSGDDP
jgi:hypothetical protein